ncbi:hypothetical protein, partial [Thiolapillus sp.]|uniref:hypothetical protein n=1 Tax=Thiolapillus sp. TaxID=2017437 RepID=UPI003AF7E94C
VFSLSQGPEWVNRNNLLVFIVINHVSVLSSCSWKPIVDYIDAQFDAFLQEELKIKRMLHSYHDSRVHACLYFIAPTGHS